MTPARPIFEYEIGKRYPGAMPGDGMLLHLHETDGDDGIEALFIVSLPNILDKELDGLVSKPIRFGILPYEPLVFLILQFSGTTLDAPFGIGLNPLKTATAILESARHARKWTAITRRVTSLVVVDPATRIIRHLRQMTLTRDWWTGLADAFEICPLELTREDYRAAQQRAYEHWPDSAAMLSDCTIIEEAGI